MQLSSTLLNRIHEVKLVKQLITQNVFIFCPIIGPQIVC